MKGWKQRELRHWRHLKVKTWQLLILLAVGVLLSVFFLRQNNLKMVELRNRVITADTVGLGIQPAITELNEHVFKHMNTKIVRPIELVETYNRQAQQAIQAASQGSGRDLYKEATQACERRGVPLASIAQCIANYVAQNSTTAAAPEIKLPNKNRFIYTFASPRWTPDAAGFSLLLTGVILIWLLARLVEYVAVRLIIRRRLKNSF